MDTSTEPATGTYTTNGIPHGYSSLTPFIAVDDADAALTFYSSVFDAQVINATRMGGVLVHAELQLEKGRLQIGAATPAYGLRAPDVEDDTVSASFGLYCPDVDAKTQRALEAGATLREAAETFVSGDRFSSIRDPFGVRWTLMTRVDDLSDAESAARVEAWAAEQE